LRVEAGNGINTEATENTEFTETESEKRVVTKTPRKSMDRCIGIKLGNYGKGASPPEVQKRNDVEKQDHAEGHDERDRTEPSEYKSSVAGARWGRGNSNDVMKSSEYLC
jgi:hypothetical protein